MSRHEDNDHHCFRGDHELYREILQARRKAHEKHGDYSIEGRDISALEFLAILTEELGEVAQCLTYDGPGSALRDELIDVLAVASAWVDHLDDNEVPA